MATTLVIDCPTDNLSTAAAAAVPDSRTILDTPVEQFVDPKVAGVVIAVRDPVRPLLAVDGTDLRLDLDGRLNPLATPGDRLLDCVENDVLAFCGHRPAMPFRPAGASARGGGSRRP